jgi:hypothetical protein
MRWKRPGRQSYAARTATEVVGGGGAGGLALGQREPFVVILWFAFVKGEAFEDEGGGGLRRLAVEFEVTGETLSGFGFHEIKTGEHDLLAEALLEETADGFPFETAPFLLS